MTKYFWTAFLILIVLMIFFVEDVMSGLKINAENLHRFSQNPVWILIAVAGVTGYFFLYRYAVSVKENSEEL